MTAADKFDPVPGQAEQIAPGLRRVLAPNPSPMTYRGTNTYLLGQRGRVLIDPGPDDPAHLAALLAAIGGNTLQAILVTHSHRDHSGLAPAGKPDGHRKRHRPPGHDPRSTPTQSSIAQRSAEARPEHREGDAAGEVCGTRPARLRPAPRGCSLSLPR
ncbi:MBL fold metallo-hydrolase [Mangrovicoccus ximenensis]|uniref:MBL fold metallo-hydrolase n=1 Tax=Mangrovicoccus ximenensis TaxID=1911570 RepID=UPI000D33A57D